MKMNFGNMEGFLLFWFIFIALTAMIHIAFAFGVFQDSAKLRETKFVPGGFWALAILIGGVWLVGIYWLIHHSNLISKDSNEAENETTSIFE
jgi:hypothetical protein